MIMSRIAQNGGFTTGLPDQSRIKTRSFSCFPTVYMFQCGQGFLQIFLYKDSSVKDIVKRIRLNVDLL